jgi:hypothetical protein
MCKLLRYSKEYTHTAPSSMMSWKFYKMNTLAYASCILTRIAHCISENRHWEGKQDLLPQNWKSARPQRQDGVADFPKHRVWRRKGIAKIKLCGFLTAKQDASQTSVSGFGHFVPGNGKTGKHATRGWMVPRFKLVVEINRKYLPLTGIETGHLALKSVNLYKQYYVQIID